MIVVDDQDPLLVFGEDCELIAQGLPMPAAKAWMLFPGDPEALHATGSIRVAAESPLPPRWSGFCLLQVDLSEVTAVSVGGSTRTVRKFDSAHIETGTPVRGVRTASGLPVLAGLPRVVIPTSMANADWDVTLHDSAGAVISRQRISGKDNPNILWDSIPRPAVGTFTVRVRGPWGRGATLAFTIVEGLSVSFTPSWRRFVSGGLQPCVVHLQAADRVELSRKKIDFGERDREQRLRASAHSEFCSLVVSPPHMTVAYQAVDFSISPSVSPLSLMREDIRDCPGELVLDVGAAAAPVLHVIVNNRVIQTVAPRCGRAGVYRFDLAGIVDTLRDHPQVSLSLSEDGELIIASVRPRRLFSGIELDEGELEFADCVNVDGLTAHVFSARAPWREPVCIPVVDGRAVLPDWLIDAGPLSVIARIEDPWVPLPKPEWPQAGESTFIDAGGWVIHDDAEETAVSMFLAGLRPLPEGVREISRLWTARALLPALGLGDRINEVSTAIEAEIYTHPAAALAALTSSDVLSKAIPSLMIRSGLAWANLADAHENTAPPWTMRGALPAALLSAADSLWSDEEIEAAVSVCGDSVNGILDGTDPYANAGRMDESADLLDREPGLREQFVRAAGLVPQGLLSADSRVLAAMEFVGERRGPRLGWLMKNAHSVLREGERLIRIIGDAATQEAFDARRHQTATGGWRVVPEVSMALALAARHAARGHIEAKRWIIRQQRPWADLADVAPQLVTIDMIIAELVVGRRAADDTGVLE
jgi:hypothetical protein